ncbi:MAG: AarF/UbiB family protein, partial [bacterium]
MNKPKSKMFGKFLLKELLGEGSTGLVHRATDTISKEDVALKILHPEVAEKVGHDRLRMQSALMAQLKDNRVVPI